MNNSNFAFLLCFALYLAPNFAAAEDWPNWMGPSRDNRWDAENILRRFPVDGPKQLWSTPVAGGYAGPAVVGDRVYLMDFVTEADVKVSNFQRKEFEGEERVLCLDANSGKMLWKHSYPVTTSVSYPAGPRCTPVVEGDLLYTLGAEGNLKCIAASSGEVVWSQDLREEYSTKSALWGYAGHPLIDGNKLITLVGGEGSHTVAFDKKTGQEIWRYGNAPEQGYSPPTIIESAGKRQLILMSPKSISSIDPETGKELWTKDYEATSGSIIMTPLQVGKHLFVGGYANRNLMLELSDGKPGAKVLFQDKPKLGISPVNVQPFLEGNLIYGMHQTGELMAVEIPSGKRLWTTSKPLADRPVGSGTAFIVQNKDVYFLFCETGELVIARLSPEGYQELDRAMVIEPTNDAFGRKVAWNPPAYANGRVYIRNDERCICLELTDGK